MRLLLFLCVGLLLCGCGDSSGPSAADEAQLAALHGAVRVQVAAVETMSLAGGTEVTGIVSAFRKATVAAEVSGRVRQRLVEPGSVVAAGAVLVELDDQRVTLSVAQAQAQLAAREVRLAQARQDLERGRRLFARGAISQDNLDDFGFGVELAHAELQAAQAALGTAERAQRDSTVKAPFAGTTELVHVQEGDYLNPGTPVATLADFSKARVRAGVTAGEAAAVAPGQPASVVFEALGGIPVAGVVHSVGRISDPSSGTYPVEIWLAGDVAAQLREGMVGAVQLASQGAVVPGPAVPRSALFRQAGRMHVFVVAAGQAKLVPVTMGRGDATHVMINAGLQVGDQVVVDGQFALRDGAAVQTN